MDKTPQEIDVMNIKWEHLILHKYLLGCLCSLSLTRTITYPFVFAKTLFQVQPQLKSGGIFKLLANTIREEGIKGIFRGCPTYLIGILPSSAAYIYSFEGLRSKVFPNRSENVKIISSSIIASFISCSISNPSDIISQRLMVLSRIKLEGSHDTSSKSIKNIAQDLYKLDGIRGFYKGFTISMLISSLTSSIWWFSYHNLKQNFEFFLKSSSDRPPSRKQYVLTQSFCGGLSTLLVGCLVHPLDVMKTRIQVLKSSSWVFLIQTLCKTEGFRWMTRGLSARLIAMAPASSFTIGIYEEVKRRSMKPNLVPVYKPKNKRSIDQISVTPAIEK